MPNPVIDQDGVVHVGNSNVDLTGVNDSTAALQACFDLLATRPNGGTIVFPADCRIRLVNGVGWNYNKNITVVGAGGLRGSVIIQEGNFAFSFASFVSNPGSSAMNVTIRNLQFVTRYSGGYGIQILDPETVDIDGIRASAGTGYWERFFNLQNIRTSFFRNMYVRNDHGAGTLDDIRGALFFLRGGAYANTDNHFEGILGQGFDTWMNIETDTQPSYEGTYINQSSIVGCNTGISWRSNIQNGYKPPLMHFSDGHIAVYRQAVNLYGVAQFFMSNLSIEQSSTFDAQAGWGNLATLAFENTDGVTLHDFEIFSSRNVSPIVFFPGCDKMFVSNVGGGAGAGAPAIVQALGGSKNLTCSGICCVNPPTMVLSGAANTATSMCRQAS